MRVISSMKFRLMLIGVVVVGLIFPLSSAMAKKGVNHKTQVKVMTRNLYLGADIFKVVEAAQTDPDTIPFAVADVFQTMQLTNFPGVYNATVPSRGSHSRGSQGATHSDRGLVCNTDNP